jgi:hypothetical protein
VIHQKLSPEIRKLVWRLQMHREEITIRDLCAVANMPMYALGDNALAFYLEMKRLGQKALIPIDRWKSVMSAEVACPCPNCGCDCTGDELVCPECGRDGCSECMPAGRGCVCPECEEGGEVA